MVLNPEKLLDLIQITVPCVKALAWDRTIMQSGTGMLTTAITGMEPANEGLPDYWIDVRVAGMTFNGADPDGETLRQIHHDALGAVQRWTPAAVTAAFGLDAPAAIVGIIGIFCTFNNSAGYREFEITCRFASTEMYLEYYEHPLPVFEVDDTGTGIQYIRFVNTSPCAVQRVTTVETTAEDGGTRSTMIHEVAFGAWAERETLTYYPINQPIPINE